MRLTPLESYAAQWLDWWVSLNPAWRECTSDHLVQEGSGDWSTMSVVGINGYLSVLAGLASAMAVQDRVRWAFAMRDVAWVIKQVLMVHKSNRCVYIALRIDCASLRSIEKNGLQQTRISIRKPLEREPSASRVTLYHFPMLITLDSIFRMLCLSPTSVCFLFQQPFL